MTSTANYSYSVYVCAMQVMVSDAQRFIEIHRAHGPVAADLSIDGWGWK